MSISPRAILALGLAVAAFAVVLAGSASLVTAQQDPGDIGLNAEGPYLGRAGIPITFSATVGDPEIRILSFNWEFGDGGQANGRVASHTYLSPGTYNVAVTVTIASGRQYVARTVAQVTAGGVTPGQLTVSAGGPYNGQINRPVLFSALVGLGGRPPGTPVQVTWNFGDGTIAQGEQVSHTYAQPGDYRVSVQASVGPGQTAADSTTVHIIGQRDIGLTAGGPYFGSVGQTIQFQGTIGDPEARVVQFQWNFGDGSGSTSGINTSHAYGNPGAYRVSLTAVLIDGERFTATTTATIGGPVLAASAGGPYSAAVNQPFTLTASVNPPGTAIREWFWVFGDGTTGIGQTVQKSYTQAGIYTATVEARPFNQDPVRATARVQIFAGPQPQPTPQPAPGDVVNLPAGCSNEALTWPVGTPMGTIANAVSPPGVVQSIFRLDAAMRRFRGFSPNVPAFANDYTMVEMQLEAVFFCLSAPGRLSRPPLDGTATQLPSPPTSTTPALVGPVHRWQGTTLNNDQRFTPTNPANYTIQLNPDGTASAQADCNRSLGSYQVSGNRLTLNFRMTTLVACPPGSLGDVFLRQLNEVSSFFFQGNQLVLELMFDTGSMIFTP